MLHDDSGRQSPGHLHPQAFPHWLQWWKRQSAVSSSFVPGPEPLSPKCPLPAQPRVRPCHLCALYRMPVVVLSVHPYPLAGAWHQQQEAEELHCGRSVGGHSLVLLSRIITSIMLEAAPAKHTSAVLELLVTHLQLGRQTHLQLGRRQCTGTVAIHNLFVKLLQADEQGGTGICYFGRKPDRALSLIGVYY